MNSRVLKIQAISCQTFSIRETRILAKQGNVGTNGFKVIRGEAKTCRSTIWKSRVKGITRLILQTTKTTCYFNSRQREVIPGQLLSAHKPLQQQWHWDLQPTWEMVPLSTLSHLWCRLSFLWRNIKCKIATSLHQYSITPGYEENSKDGIITSRHVDVTNSPKRIEM